ncbi:hypothetical protein ANCCAN_05796, partial [Ancylostoma caninum]
LAADHNEENFKRSFFSNRTTNGRNCVVPDAISSLSTSKWRTDLFTRYPPLPASSTGGHPYDLLYIGRSRIKPQITSIRMKSKTDQESKGSSIYIGREERFDAALSRCSQRQIHGYVLATTEGRMWSPSAAASETRWSNKLIGQWNGCERRKEERAMGITGIYGAVRQVLREIARRSHSRGRVKTCALPPECLVLIPDSYFILFVPGQFIFPVISGFFILL